MKDTENSHLTGNTVAHDLFQKPRKKVVLESWELNFRKLNPGQYGICFTWQKKVFARCLTYKVAKIKQNLVLFNG